MSTSRSLRPQDDGATSPSKVGTGKRSVRPPYKFMTNELRVKIIQKREECPDMTQHELAEWAHKEFNLRTKPGQSTISGILHRKDEILQQLRQGGLSYGSSRPVRFPEFDKILVNWVRAQQEDANAPIISNETIRTKGKEFLKLMGLSEQLALSNGWIDSFVNRHGIKIWRNDDDDRGSTEGDDSASQVNPSEEAIDSNFSVQLLRASRDYDAQASDVAPSETNEAAVAVPATMPMATDSPGSSSITPVPVPTPPLLVDDNNTSFPASSRPRKRTKTSTRESDERLNELDERLDRLENKWTWDFEKLSKKVVWEVETQAEERTLRREELNVQRELLNLQREQLSCQREQLNSQREQMAKLLELLTTLVNSKKTDDESPL